MSLHSKCAEPLRASSIRQFSPGISEETPHPQEGHHGEWCYWNQLQPLSCTFWRNNHGPASCYQWVTNHLFSFSHPSLLRLHFISFILYFRVSFTSIFPTAVLAVVSYKTIILDTFLSLLNCHFCGWLLWEQQCLCDSRVFALYFDSVFVSFSKSADV